MLNFDQKSPFLRKSQKTCFLPLFVQNKLKIDKIKINFEFLFGFQTSHWMLRFLIFVSFCWFYELHAKYG